MSTPCSAKLDLARIAANMSAEEGRSVGVDEAAAWLEENGFVRDGGTWLAEFADVITLREDEILDCVPLIPAPVPPGPAEVYRPQPGDYVLSPERRQALSRMHDYDKCVVPAFLCGRPRQVRQATKKAVRRAVKERSWKRAMVSEEYVHIDDAPGWIVLTPPLTGLGDTESFLTYEANLILADWAPGEPGSFEIMRDLKVENAGSFWGCLGIISFLGWSKNPSHQERLRQAARDCFPKIMRWWPHFCARDDRFFAGTAKLGRWPSWGLPNEFYKLFGWPIDWNYLRSVDPLTAAKRFRELWLADGGEPW